MACGPRDRHAAFLRFENGRNKHSFLRVVVMTRSPQVFGEQLAAARRVKNISQAALAAAIKKSQAHISNFERGRARLSASDEKIIRRVLGLGR
jgi:DNA-binding transcriptional regulator YiaG